VRAHILLLLLTLGSVFALPANFIKASGEVFLDGEKIADLNSSAGETYLALPLIPGTHTVSFDGKQVVYRIFDVNCSGDGQFVCNITAYANITLPFEIECENYRYEGRVSVVENESRAVSANCYGEVRVRIGDWEEIVNVTRIFRNTVDAGEGRWIYVYQNKTLILKKYGRNLVSFPELDPGRYVVLLVGDGIERGELVIQRSVGLMVAGYALAALVVIASLVLLWTD